MGGGGGVLQQAGCIADASRGWHIQRGLPHLASHPRGQPHQCAEPRSPSFLLSLSLVLPRLQALRELVPHDQRSNTATFLEGVISYIKTLQDSNAQLEAQLTSLQAMRAAAAAHLEQHQELLAQPAGSGSNAAHSGAVQHQHQQQCINSSWRQDSITGPAPASPEAAAAATASAQWQGAAAGSTQQQPPHDDVADAALAIQALQQHFQQHQQQAAYTAQRQACSSSPPLAAVVAGAAAAAGPASTTLSAPAALTHTLAQHAPGTMQAATEGGGATPTATGAAATSGLLPPPGSLQLPASSDGTAAAMQPAELQVVLEKALLAALQQQAQQLASQLLSRGP